MEKLTGACPAAGQAEELYGQGGIYPCYVEFPPKLASQGIFNKSSQAFLPNSQRTRGLQETNLFHISTRPLTFS